MTNQEFRFETMINQISYYIQTIEKYYFKLKNNWDVFIDKWKIEDAFKEFRSTLITWLACFKENLWEKYLNEVEEVLTQIDIDLHLLQDSLFTQEQLFGEELPPIEPEILVCNKNKVWVDSNLLTKIE